MAGADIENGLNIVTSHFGRKPDVSGTILMKIEDIVHKMQSSPEEEFFKSETLEHGDMKLNLKIYPNGMDNGRDRIILINVNLENPEKRKWSSVKTRIAEDSAGVFFKTRSILPLKGKANISHQYIISHDTVLLDKNAAFLPDGVFTVKTIITIPGEETVTHTSSKLPQKSVTPTQLKQKLTEDFKTMLENQSFSDFRIICQGEVVPCHRVILSARSDIFGAMLEHNMKESETGEVVINDFDLTTVKALLMYMYSGEVEHYQGNSKQLMKAADKYRVEELKNSIEDALIQDVKVENAIDMFVLGDAVNAYKLRDISKDIIVRNAVAITKIDGWKQVLGKYQDLTLEILESVIDSKVAI